MARKAKHDQRAIPNDWSCSECKNDNCDNCIDIPRVILMGKNPICHCKRRKHSGEAVDNQITDPETGTVYGPGLRITTDGEVLRGGYDGDGGH